LAFAQALQVTIMSTTTRLTFAEYEKLPEKEGVRYELDEGTLLMEPSPALNHNLIRQRIASHLTQFVRSHNLGIVVEEMDFRLDTDTVISPSNLAQDTAKKVRQYLAAGCHAVWLVYPALRLVEIHNAAGARRITEPEPLQESKIFSGFKFSLSLTALFDDIFRQ
jgi:Uma2 family endonuclease